MQSQFITLSRSLIFEAGLRGLMRPSGFAADRARSMAHKWETKPDQILEDQQNISLGQAGESGTDGASSE